MVVHKYDLGDYSKSMSFADKDKLMTKFIRVTVKTNAVVRWLGVKVENSHVRAWALVKAGHAQADRHFIIVPTGFQLNYEFDALAHVGTFNEKQFEHVWHVFEILRD